MSVSALRELNDPCESEPRSATLRACVEAAARRAARSIPHLDLDCLRAMLAAHVELKLHHFRGEAPLEHWLNRVLRNKVLDLVRFERSSMKDCVAIDDAHEQLADRREGPERGAALQELRARIEAEHAVSREGRILHLLLTGEVSTVTEAAKLLGWNHPTALARMRKHPLVLELLRNAV